MVYESGKSPRYQHRGVIEYVITLAGPQPLEHVPLDYEHRSRQLFQFRYDLTFRGLTLRHQSTIASFNLIADLAISIEIQYLTD